MRKRNNSGKFTPGHTLAASVRKLGIPVRLSSITQEVMKGLYQTGNHEMSCVLGSLVLNNWIPNIAMLSCTPWAPSCPNPVSFALKLECSTQ